MTQVTIENCDLDIYFKDDNTSVSSNLNYSTYFTNIYIKFNNTMTTDYDIFMNPVGNIIIQNNRLNILSNCAKQDIAVANINLVTSTKINRDVIQAKIYNNYMYSVSKTKNISNNVISYTIYAPSFYGSLDICNNYISVKKYKDDVSTDTDDEGYIFYYGIWLLSFYGSYLNIDNNYICSKTRSLNVALSSSSSDSKIYGNKLQRINISNNYIDATRYRNTGTSVGNCINLAVSGNTNNSKLLPYSITIDNCVMLNSGGCAFYINFPSQNSTLANQNNFVLDKDYYTHNKQNILIKGCYISSVTDGTVIDNTGAVMTYMAFDVIFDDCYIEDFVNTSVNSTFSTSCVKLGGMSGNVIFTNCTILGIFINTLTPSVAQNLYGIFSDLSINYSCKLSVDNCKIHVFNNSTSFTQNTKAINISSSSSNNCSRNTWINISNSEIISRTNSVVTPGLSTLTLFIYQQQNTRQ